MVRLSHFLYENVKTGEKIRLPSKRRACRYFGMTYSKGRWFINKVAVYV